MELYGKKNTYELGKKISSGGEGSVYKLLDHTKHIAKIYKAERITPHLEEKIEYMVSHKPVDKYVLSQIAWPLDVLRDKDGLFVGFVMLRMDISDNLKTISVYPSPLDISIEQKIIVACNICTVMADVHKLGYVFGDFNPKNIGVNLQNGHVAFFDTDTYHFTADDGRSFRCTVAFSGYLAPEVIEKQKYGGGLSKADLPTFTKESDDFALAIHIFKLLMNGYSPYCGVKESEKDNIRFVKPDNNSIEEDTYCFKPEYVPFEPAVPSITSLPSSIAKLFTNTFIDGITDPTKRTTPEEWKNALMKFKSHLTQCEKNPLHYYYSKKTKCPYCAADARYKKEIARREQITFANPVPVVNLKEKSNSKSGDLFELFSVTKLKRFVRSKLFKLISIAFAMIIVVIGIVIIM